MPFDHFEIVTPFDRRQPWPSDWRYKPAVIVVNGEPFLELVRQTELPLAEAEWDERKANNPSASLGERGGVAGGYEFNCGGAFPPCRALWGEPYQHGFETGPNDPSRGKSLVAWCTCGIVPCWFLLAKITVEADTITWSDFQQFHRDWDYSLGPFVFDRQQYASQLIGGHLDQPPAPEPRTFTVDELCPPPSPT